MKNTLAFLRRPRPCRVCGTVFRPERWDALTCSDTCRSLRMRGQDLAYVADLPETQQTKHRQLHSNIGLAIEVLKTTRTAEGRYRRESDIARDAYLAVLKHFESE